MLRYHARKFLCIRNSIGGVSGHLFPLCLLLRRITATPMTLNDAAGSLNLFRLANRRRSTSIFLRALISSRPTVERYWSSQGCLFISYEGIWMEADHLRPRGATKRGKTSLSEGESYLVCKDLISCQRSTNDWQNVCQSMLRGG